MALVAMNVLGLSFGYHDSAAAIVRGDSILAAAQEELDATNGESNEARRALENGITSPMGHGTLESLMLAPARIVRRMAGDWREENGLPREGD